MKSTFFIIISLFVFQYAFSNDLALTSQTGKDKSLETQILLKNNECCELDGDGNVSIFEGVDGSITKFAIDEVGPKETSEKIVKSMKAKTALSEKAANELMEKIAKNPEIRIKYLYTFVDNFKMFANKGTSQEQLLEKFGKDGFKRTKNNNEIEELFNKEGKIEKISKIEKPDTIEKKSEEAKRPEKERLNNIGMICQFQRMNDLGRKEIEKEKKAGKISGYVNASKLQELGSMIVNNEEHIETYKNKLLKDNKYKFKPNDCK